MRSLSRSFAYTLLFFSGGTGLIYEFCWSKRLANWLGNTGQAHAILLATFMGGLAAGAWLFGRTADRVKRPLRLYGALELGVGLLALAFPYALELAGTAYLAVGRSGGNGARLVLAVVLLLPPTLLMGGSLPAMTRHLTRALGTARSTLASLYAVNSLGAALGSLFAGLLFVPAAGLLVSERFAVLLNVLVGLAALLSAREDAGASLPESGEASRTYGDGAVRAALLGTALSGFTAMLYEVTWIRLLAIIIGGTSYAFTLILSAFILGISLGSFWISRRPDREALRTFGWLQVALVAVVCLTIPLYRRLPFYFFKLSASLEPAHTWDVYLLLTFLFCGALLVLPAALMGASFPVAARVAMRSADRVGGEVGRVYLWNTAGTILGSLAGGLLLLPAIGLEGNFVVGLGANLLAAVIAFLAQGDGTQRRQLFAAGAIAVLAAAVTLSTSGWARFISSAGRSREWSGSFSRFDAFERAVSQHAEVRFYADDVFASVMVGEQRGGHRFLRINGKADGSNDPRDVDTQVLAAHLGVLAHPREVKKVLLVGIGAGITAGSLLAHPIERLDVVEISPAVLDAAKLFSPDNGDALTDPRCHVYLEDARTFLSLSKERYDLIVSVPSNPWVTGVSGLFSQDFFRIARERLAPGGRVVQWIHTYESNESLVKLVVRTLSDSFEHGTSWLGTADLVLVASREPQVFDADVISARMARPAVAKDLARLHLTKVSTLLARQVHSDEGQRAFAGEGPVNTDDHNLLEYLSPIAYFTSGSALDVGDERVGATPGHALEVAKYVASHPLGPAELAELHATLAEVHRPAEPLLRSVSAQWVAVAPGDGPAAVALARAALAQGDVEVARAVLAPLVQSGADDVRKEWARAEAEHARRVGSVFRPLSPRGEADGGWPQR